MRKYKVELQARFPRLDGRNPTFCVVDVECSPLTPRKRKKYIPKDIWRGSSELYEKIKIALKEIGEKDSRYKDFDSLYIIQVRDF